MFDCQRVDALLRLMNLALTKPPVHQAFQRLLNDDLRETSERGWAKVSRDQVCLVLQTNSTILYKFFDSRVKYEMHIREFLDIPKLALSHQDHLQIGNSTGSNTLSQNFTFQSIQSFISTFYEGISSGTLRHISAKSTAKSPMIFPIRSPG